MSESIRLPVAVKLDAKQSDPITLDVTDNILNPEVATVSSLKNEIIAINDKINILNNELLSKNNKIEELTLIQQEGADYDALNYLFQEFESSVKDAVDRFSYQASDVVVAALVKILGKSLVKPEVALAAIKEVVSSSNESEVHKVFVSPKDYLLIEKYKAQLQFSESINFVSDVKVESGGCILELTSGLVDGRVEVQLKTLHELLRNSRG